MKARIAEIEALSPAIKRIALAAADGAPLPTGSAGAHIMPPHSRPGPGVEERLFPGLAAGRS